MSSLSCDNNPLTLSFWDKVKPTCNVKFLCFFPLQTRLNLCFAHKHYIEQRANQEVDPGVARCSSVVVPPILFSCTLNLLLSQHSWTERPWNHVGSQRSRRRLQISAGNQRHGQQRSVSVSQVSVCVTRYTTTSSTTTTTWFPLTNLLTFRRSKMLDKGWTLTVDFFFEGATEGKYKLLNKTSKYT